MNQPTRPLLQKGECRAVRLGILALLFVLTQATTTAAGPITTIAYAETRAGFTWEFEWDKTFFGDLGSFEPEESAGFSNDCIADVSDCWTVDIKSKFLGNSFNLTFHGRHIVELHCVAPGCAPIPPIDDTMGEEWSQVEAYFSDDLAIGANFPFTASFVTIEPLNPNDNVLPHETSAERHLDRYVIKYKRPSFRSNITLRITGEHLRIPVRRHLAYGTAAFGDTFDDSKTALLPGETATSANVTGFTGGITTLIYDIDDNPGAISSSDITFTMGTSDDPSDPAPDPDSFSYTAGGGEDGSNRLRMEWAPGTLTNTYLQLSIDAAAAGLPADDVSAWGSLPSNVDGDVGSAKVTIDDVIGVFIGQAGGGTGLVGDGTDTDKDGNTDIDDVINVFIGQGQAPLPFISLSNGGGGGGGSAAQIPEPGSITLFGIAAGMLGFRRRRCRRK